MKKLFFTLMFTILASAGAWAGDSLAVSMVKYVQNWSDEDSSTVPEPLTVVERVADEPVGVLRKSSDKDRIYDVVEQMPHFPGGDAALIKYLNDHINYPSVAQENGVQGRVVISFVVEHDGSISGVKVARSVDPSLDREAIRVVQSMPHWVPGKLNGSAVRVKYMMPVSFRLSDNVNHMKKDDIQRFDDVFRQ